MLNIFNKENLLDRFIRLRFHQYPISYIDRPVDGWIPYTSADLPEAAGSGSYVHTWMPMWRAVSQSECTTGQLFIS